MPVSVHHRRRVRAMTPEQREAYDRLRSLLPKGSTAYTVLDGSPSASGMRRWINVYAIKRNRPVYIAGLMAIAFPDWFKRGSIGSKHPGALQVDGAGMDMGFHLVYGLSHRLYGDGYAIKQRWI